MNDFMQTLRIIDENRKDEFFNKGYKKRYFFPHEVYYLPRCGPEGFFFANRMWNISNPNSLWEIIPSIKDAVYEVGGEFLYEHNIVLSLLPIIENTINERCYEPFLINAFKEGIVCYEYK
ncbi:MAG: hypothetical protein GY795_40635 [Desulfobacterales bacterium]|nr:hypothetical protein [Desulfobacterales bacterium]